MLAGRELQAAVWALVRGHALILAAGHARGDDVVPLAAVAEKLVDGRSVPRPAA